MFPSGYGWGPEVIHLSSLLGRTKCEGTAPEREEENKQIKSQQHLLNYLLRQIRLIVYVH